MCESLRLDGKLCRVTVSRESGRWRVSLVVDTQMKPNPRGGERVIGADVGLKHLAVTSLDRDLNAAMNLKRVGDFRPAWRPR